MYAVLRRTGKTRDWLTSINDYWGTVCGGDGTPWTARHAVPFTTLEAAQAGARKARRACMGWNHDKKQQRRLWPRPDFVAVKVSPRGGAL